MKRLEITAHNVANVTTPSFQPLQVHQTTGPGGQGTVATVTHPDFPVPLPDQPGALEDLPALSNVDLVAETGQQILSQRAFEANLGVFNTADEMMQLLVNTGR